MVLDLAKDLMVVLLQLAVLYLFFLVAENVLLFCC